MARRKNRDRPFHEINFETRESENSHESYMEMKEREGKENVEKFVTALNLHSKLYTPKNEIKMFGDDERHEFLDSNTFELGYVHCILGFNGSGKSTLLEAIARKYIQRKYGEPLKEDTNFSEVINNEDYTSPLIFHADYAQSFFKSSTGEMSFDLINSVDKTSTGIQKIQSLNSMFLMLKEVFLNDRLDTENKLDLILLLDEPDSNLSPSYQKVLFETILTYFNRINSIGKVRLSIFMGGHFPTSQLDSELVKVWEIQELKKDNKLQCLDNPFLSIDS